MKLVFKLLAILLFALLIASVQKQNEQIGKETVYTKKLSAKSIEAYAKKKAVGPFANTAK